MLNRSTVRHIHNRESQSRGILSYKQRPMGARAKKTEE